MAATQFQPKKLYQKLLHGNRIGFTILMSANWCFSDVQRLGGIYGSAGLCGLLKNNMEAEFYRGNNRVWVRRQPGCPFNLYSTIGSEAYRLTAAFPKNWNPEQAAAALLETGFEQVGCFAVVADVKQGSAPSFRYTDRRYRYTSLRRALQTLSNLRRIQLGGKGWHWKIVHYYTMPA